MEHAVEQNDLQPRISAGAAAQRLLDSEDYQLAIKEAQSRILNDWATTAPHEHARRDDLYAEMRGIQQVDLSLRLRTEDGEVAKSVLSRVQAKLKNLFA